MLVMLGKIAVASSALVLLCLASSHWLLADWALQAFWSRLGTLLATILAGAAVFVACGALLGIDELDELLGLVRRRFRRAR